MRFSTEKQLSPAWLRAGRPGLWMRQDLVSVRFGNIDINNGVF